MTEQSTEQEAGRERAWEACADYERWASEIWRLSKEIRAIRCEEEADAEFDPVSYGMISPAAPSCFSRASEQFVPAGPLPDDGDRPIRLDEIAPLVADCPGCSRLVELIRARKVARQRLGVAKRKVRAVGKRAAVSVVSS